MTKSSTHAFGIPRYLWRYFIVVLIAVLPIFAHLDEQPLVLYDEQRLATNALEMVESGNLLVTTYDGKPDYSNTKPPLMIWLQAISMCLLGYNELAVRLPAALAALATCLLLFEFCRCRFNSIWLGLYSVAILCTTQGYIDIHGTRTGDYDALLTCFTTAYCLSWFIYLEDGSKKHLYLFFVTLMLAVMTKCTAACLMLPSLAIYTILRGKLVTVLKNKHVYLGILILLAPVAAWYIVRQLLDAGYIGAVWKMDISGRYTEVMSYIHGPEYYAAMLTEGYFAPWLIFAIAGTIPGLLSKQLQLYRLSLYLLLTTAGFIAVLSFSATKFYWYLLPAYPLLAILAAISLKMLIKAIIEAAPLHYSWAKSAAFMLTAILLFSWPYAASLDRSINAKIHESIRENMVMGTFMKDVLHGRRNIDGSLVAIEGGEGNIRWYFKALSIAHRPVTTIENRQFTSGQRIIAFEYELKEYIEQHFVANLIEDFRGVHIYEIIRPKS